MIIPVRCFTCGKVLADKWNEYVKRCGELEGGAASGIGGTASKMDGERPGADGKTARGRVLDELGISSCCCRVVMLTHVDLSLVI